MQPTNKNKSKEETPPVENNSVNVGRLNIHEEPIPLMQQYTEDTSTTGLVFKKPLSKKAKKKIKELQKGTTVIPITPTTETSYDGNKINRPMDDDISDRILPHVKKDTEAFHKVTALMPKGLSLMEQLEWREKNL